MRGKVGCHCNTLLIIRITPAYAGKSESSLRNTAFLTDHPRVCGEKTLSNIVHMCAIGSPPRMRGKASEYMELTDELRITPAYAGKRKKDGA